MGAAPSREGATASLAQVPFYGQRQQVVLIPLLKEFFPTVDCPLFQQLYSARCDPAVRYYHHVRELEETDEERAKQHRRRAAYEAGGGEGTETALDAHVGRFHCLPTHRFPPMYMDKESFYHAYVDHSDARAFATDAEMFAAFEAHPQHIRPLPCAVAFLYQKSSAAPCAAGAAGGEGADGGQAAEAKEAAEGTGMEDCAEVLGCQVKITGFVGDATVFQRQVNFLEDNFELYIFLTKSAGDHNRTHVFVSAVYTFAAQWQRACLRQLERRRAAPSRPALQPADHPDSAAYVAYCQRVAEEADGATRGWMPPPLPAMTIRSRRANVPLLCFLRELRSMLISMHLSERPAAEEASVDEGDRHCRTAALQEVRMWLDDVEVDAAAGDGDGADADATTTAHRESFLIATAAAPVVEALVRHVVERLLVNVNPLDIVRHGSGNSSAPAAEAAEAEERSKPAVPLLRLPDEGMMVESVPLVGSTGGLKGWRALYPEYHLFWVLGSELRGATRTATMLKQWLEEGLPILDGFGDGEVAVTRPEQLYKYLRGGAPTASGAEPLMEVGVVLSLPPMIQGSEEDRPLRVCRLPLEELLLAELRNTCKLAREAGPEDLGWVRDAAHAPAATAADADVDVPARPAAALDIVGDGAACLWQVRLPTGTTRIVAVTPFFLKTVKKKTNKRKKAIPKSSAAYGTAADVFFSVAEENKCNTTMETKKEATAAAAAPAPAPAPASAPEEASPPPPPPAPSAAEEPAEAEVAKPSKKAKKKKAAAEAVAAAAVTATATTAAAPAVDEEAAPITTTANATTPEKQAPAAATPPPAASPATEEPQAPKGPVPRPPEPLCPPSPTAEPLKETRSFPLAVPRSKAAAAAAAASGTPAPVPVWSEPPPPAASYAHHPSSYSHHDHTGRSNPWTCAPPPPPTPAMASYYPPPSAPPGDAYDYSRRDYYSPAGPAAPPPPPMQPMPPNGMYGMPYPAPGWPMPPMGYYGGGGGGPAYDYGYGATPPPSQQPPRQPSPPQPMNPARRNYSGVSLYQNSSQAAEAAVPSVTVGVPARPAVSRRDAGTQVTMEEPLSLPTFKAPEPELPTVMSGSTTSDTHVHRRHVSFHDVSQGARGAATATATLSEHNIAKPPPQLYFNPEGMNSPTTTSSANFPNTAQFQMSLNSPRSPSGSHISNGNMTVHVRHGTAGGSGVYGDDHPHGGSASLRFSVSHASVDSSVRRRTTGSPTTGGEHHERSSARAPAPAPSSTYSGDTGSQATSSVRRVDKTGKKFRWDWRQSGVNTADDFDNEDQL